ncbi:MAG: CopD family protein [Xanthomonadaceae bacterium]|nr:CopD family protein [Xanthomonadaceae bacterium]
MAYLTYKAFHIIFMVTWFAGLFYLPRIYVYHAMNRDTKTIETFKVMERKLMIMTHIGGTLTLIFGLIMLMKNPILLKMPWMHIKLTLVFLLFVYHGFCYHYMMVFRVDGNKKTHKFYRFFNEIPSIIIVAVVLLVILKRPTIGM